MEERVPSWLNKEFLKKVLIDGGNTTSNIDIQNYSVNLGVSEGDNYGSTIYSVTVDYSEKENNSSSKRLIIKAPINGEGIFKDIVEEGNFLNNECIFYNEIIPKLREISAPTFSPKSYYCDIEEVLVLEDLKVKGYKMCDRRDQLDYSHCAIFIVTLAKLHASTVALHEKYPEIVENNGNEAIFTEKITMADINSCQNEDKIKKLASMVEQVEGMELLANAIYGVSKTLGSRIVDILNETDWELKVLNHGDCWVNNILYKYDESGQIVDCKLIDFQLRRFVSPAVDLVYFLFSSPQVEVRENHMEQLIQLYRQTFNKHLSQLGCNIKLSAHQLKSDLTFLVPFAVFVSAIFLPFMVAERNFINNSDDCEVSHLKQFSGKTLRNMLPHLCKQLISFGVLEYYKS